MKRREFLKTSAYSSALVGGTSLSLSSKVFSSPGYGDGNGKILLNTMLLGGADLRHLFVPPPTTDYGIEFWAARKSIFFGGANWDPNASYTADYDEITIDGVTFGINKKAAWLKQQILNGNVAIVCNVFGSSNQRHDHSQLIMNSGNPDIQNYNFDTSGWGGRLVESIGNVANVVSLAKSISLFCYGSNPSDRNTKVISAPDTRNIALLEIGSDVVKPPSQQVMARVLKSYYQKKNDVDLEGTPYLKILQHERAIRSFGQNINSVLSQNGNEPSQALQDLITGTTTIAKLNQPDFGHQCSGVYDSLLVNQADPSYMGFRVASMEYNDWDTHKNLKNRFEKNLDDLFGLNRALHTLDNELKTKFGTNIGKDMVYTFTSDFGRQIASNGTNGTDHGVGTYMMVMGESVRGGIYGEMFPLEDIIPNANNQTRFNQQGAYIIGKTSFERVLGEVVDWIQPGSGSIIFTNRDTAAEESGANLYTLFSKTLYTISGQVTSTLGNGISGATVIITSATNPRINWTLTTTDDGSFSSDQLAINDSYNISVTKTGYLFESSSVTILDTDSTINFIGTPGEFTGTVSGRITTPDGRGIADLTFWDVSKYPSKVTTDSNGYFIIEGYTGGETVWLNMYSAADSKYTYEPAGWDGAAFVHNGAAEVARNFIFTPVAGSISGRIVDEFGDGIAGLTFWDVSQYPETVTTDSDGYFMITGYSGGETVWFNMYTAIGNQYTYEAIGWPGGSIIHDGSAMSGYDFVFTRKQGTISGRITTPDGIGIPGLTFWDVSRYPTTVTTDANGYYVIGGYSDGDLVYFNMSAITDYDVKAAGWSGSQFNHDGSTLIRDFVATPINDTSFSGTVSGRITTPDGNGIADITFWDVSKYPEKVTTDKDGYFVIKGYKGGESVWLNLYTATNGKYTYQAAGWDGGVFVHNGNAETGRNYIFTPVTGSLSGRIVDEFGDGIAGLTFWDVGKYPDTVTTDSDGNFMITGYNSGDTIWLNLYTARGNSYTSIADGWSGGTIIHDGTAMSGYNYIFTRKSGTISGRMTTPDGKGIPNLTFWDVNRFPDKVTTDANGYYIIDGYTAGDNVYLNTSNIADYIVTASGWNGGFFQHDGNAMTRDYILTLK
ncbi:MAG TPA: DUF1501 domain-containing protein [Gammaproteobacteria bacterium]|nr:DUF1501 domain-containing protein [Gammaproteobacteria bacterium]